MHDEFANWISTSYIGGQHFLDMPHWQSLAQDLEPRSGHPTGLSGQCFAAIGIKRYMRSLPEVQSP
ncbi:hypothetical protein PGT21_019277 [Puccinia graminis f. sp. tritici]|uniref:Uncharacterized protein n=1 Tax=Puccinia graminis f. sp. tritici TaxID=56615 RepID=A0A5B0P6B3_PUCGR|nr:hypothetical protein PGT21_019277 [Puccinia graminis f. sp. tritici]KAA1131911.1 hypothetical protein PGTUg99_033403 [Puccinia graminis f. sp. tritici]